MGGGIVSAYIGGTYDSYDNSVAEAKEAAAVAAVNKRVADATASALAAVPDAGATPTSATDVVSAPASTAATATESKSTIPVSTSVKSSYCPTYIQEDILECIKGKDITRIVSSSECIKVLNLCPRGSDNATIQFYDDDISRQACGAVVDHPMLQRVKYGDGGDSWVCSGLPPNKPPIPQVEGVYRNYKLSGVRQWDKNKLISNFVHINPTYSGNEKNIIEYSACTAVAINMNDQNSNRGGFRSLYAIYGIWGRFCTCWEKIGTYRESGLGVSMGVLGQKSFSSIDTCIEGCAYHCETNSRL
jgi:hypothetical protein